MLSLVAVVAAWMKGGHPERLGAVSTIVVFAVSFWTHELMIGPFYAGDAVLDLFLTAFFVWMALTRDRWWPLAMSAIMTLTVLVYVAALVVPGVGPYAVMSARVGLGLLTTLILLAGVGERWLAGERAISDLKNWRRRRPLRRQGISSAA
ncbi:hypothetical protein [Brevundimonas sp.]|uniref:hypothetical protein n=1 Tax=Brevundimonas sp. TaxID=1871086 RepID=UPI002D523A96|nr:hypothetical protein [Brevundimonas sp.]HYC74213.1 hypothetical protein [Brevundimonas sp.]